MNDIEGIFVLIISIFNFLPRYEPKYNFNDRRLQDDFHSLKERVLLRLVPPTEDTYFTNLLKVI